MAGDQIEPNSVSGETRFIGSRSVFLCLLILLLVACNAAQPVPVDSQGEKVSQLEQRITELEQQVDQQQQKISELNERIALLNAHAEAQQSGEPSDQIEALINELITTRGLLSSAQEQAAAAKRELAVVQADNEALLNELDEVYEELGRIQGATAAPNVEATPPPPELQPSSGITSAGDDDLYVQIDDDGSLKMELFYGTNRLPIEPSIKRYFTPFLIPLILLALLLFLPRVIRFLFRDRLHRVSINLVRVAFIVALVYFVPAGTQKTVLRWQADHSLLVQYGPKRRIELTDGERYSVGTCIVSIPPVHVAGKVELPDLMHFEFSADPKKHFVLQDISPLERHDYFAKLKSRVTNSREQSLFVFVHGFHNTFQDAAFRTAQIAHDMNFPGVPVFFSWPSQGKVLDYTTDENNVGEAVSHLTDFLTKLRAESGADRIHVIAHSMGSRALTAAVKDIGSRHDGPVFNEMVLAAPDIDAGLFRNLAPDLVSATDRVTLYASSKDNALTASRQVHGGSNPRAGESLPTPVVVSPVESIDVSNVTSGHSYIANSGRILDDLNNILLYNRKLDADMADVKTDRNGQLYWKLK